MQLKFRTGAVVSAAIFGFGLVGLNAAQVAQGTPPVPAGEQTVTLAGCITPDTPVASGLPAADPNSTTRSEPVTFILKNAQIAKEHVSLSPGGGDMHGTSGAGTTTPTTTPFSGPTPAEAKAPSANSKGGMTTGKEVALNPGPNVALSAHLNHQVEVTGSVRRADWEKWTMPPAPEASPSPSDRTASSGTTPGGRGASLVLAVTSVTMMSPTCQ